MRVGLAAALALPPRPDLVVVATDGFTPWPDRRPPGVVVVALIGGGPPAPPWARTIRVPVGPIPGAEPAVARFVYRPLCDA